MKMKTSGIIVALAVLAVQTAGPAWGIRIESAAAPAPDAVRKADKAVPAVAHADDRSSMREGVITAISDKRDRIQVNGSWLKLADGATRVFRQGRAVQPDALAKGQKVRFTLAAGVADRSTLGAIYVP